MIPVSFTCSDCRVRYLLCSGWVWLHLVMKVWERGESEGGWCDSDKFPFVNTRRQKADWMWQNIWVHSFRLSLFCTITMDSRGRKQWPGNFKKSLNVDAETWQSLTGFFLLWFIYLFLFRLIFMVVVLLRSWCSVFCISLFSYFYICV